MLATHFPRRFFKAGQIIHGCRCVKLQRSSLCGSTSNGSHVILTGPKGKGSIHKYQTSTMDSNFYDKRHKEFRVGIHSRPSFRSNMSLYDFRLDLSAEVSRFSRIEIVPCFQFRNFSSNQKPSVEQETESYRQHDDSTDQESKAMHEEYRGKPPVNVDDKASEETTKPLEKQSRYKEVRQSIRRFMKSFLNGLKNLYGDVRLAFKINKKLKQHDYDQSKLSRNELFHLKQTKKDVIKTAPVTFIFMLPFVGYLAPLLAYLYPKRLLSRQFWQPDQMQQFLLEDHAKRSQFYLPLVREVGWACKESEDKDLLKVVMKAIDGYHIENELLLTRIESFEADEAISLCNMPRYHLEKLCKTWMIPAKWYMPRKLLIERLRWRVRNILHDDEAIRRDGVKSMSEEGVKQACHHRGLEEILYTRDLLKEWLEDWVALTAHVDPMHHVSFTAHCAVFKSLNFCKDKQEQRRKEGEDQEDKKTS